MKRALLLLRVTLGLFLVIWGGDKLVNVEHTIAVSDGFYFGLLSGGLVVAASGVVQILLGIAVVSGKFKPVAYTLMLLIYSGTLLAVWRSILDPLQLFMDGGNPVFFSSAIIWSGAYLLWTQRNEEPVSET